MGHNDGPGIWINSSNENVVTNNYVGTDALDGADFGNSGPGIKILASENNVIGHSYGASFSNPLPEAGGDGNVIAHNGDDGVQISGSDNPQQNPVRGNAMYQNGAADNTEIGIDLGDDGLTANDNATDDGDSGPNRLQNFPVINALDFDSGNDEVTIRYTISTAAANADYGTDGLKVDFYAADSKASGEGKTYLDTQFYDSPGQEKQVVLSVPSAMTEDDHIVATVTDAAGNTSEFLGTSQQLPVELAGFNARSDDGDVTLSWQTASETNNAGFTVQHRSVKASRTTGMTSGPRDASTEDDDTEEVGWQKVGFVESRAKGGTTTEALSYQFSAVDLGVGTHQFRLKQVDLDGAVHIHDAVTVEVRMQQALRLAPPTPNPVRGRAALSFAVREQSEATLTLYNTLGQRVRVVYRGTPPAGEQQTAVLSGSGLGSGVYFLRLRADGQSTTRKVTVVR